MFQVVYFTATFPYLVLFILMIRGATLDGSLDGVLFYLKPDVAKLKDPRVWLNFFYLASNLGSNINGRVLAKSVNFSSRDR